MSITAAAPVTAVPVSAEPIYRLLFGRPLTQFLYSALELGLFEKLSKGSLDEKTLQAELSLARRPYTMLLGMAVAVGLLTKEGDQYANTAIAKHYLVQGSPFYLGGLLDHFKHQVFPAWDSLTTAIREDGPQIRSTTKNGTSTDIFQVTESLDDQTRWFIEAMHGLSVSDGLVLANAFDFSNVKRMVDVGGGSGALSLAVASCYPNLEAIVWDRPAVCQVAQEHIDQHGLEKRVKTLAGDAFADPIPESVDLILMSLFIHAFGLERATPLVKKAFEALPPGGTFLIYEPVLHPDGTGPMTALFSSLNMLVATPSGEDITAQAYQEWLKQIGFIDVFYKPLPAVRHVIGGFKPKR